MTNYCQCANVVCAQFGCQRARQYGYWPAMPPMQQLPQRGCICPPGSEQTCQGHMCPRKPLGMSGLSPTNTP